MKKRLLKNAYKIYTFNDEDQILEFQNILIVDNKISKIGKDIPLDEDVEIIDVSNKILLPGFVNTHHHLYQTMFRCIDEVQELPLFPWLKGLYEFWKYLNEETVYLGSLVGFSELIRTGCTTTMDHHYVFPENSRKDLIDFQFKASEEIGIRFHASRGSMSLGKDKGGLPPNCVVQTEDEILEDSERLIDKYHDKDEFAMKRVLLAPCSPFSVTKDLLKKSAELARKKGVMLHTHLAETMDEEGFCIQMYGLRPVELMEDVGFIGGDTWFAHGIYLNDEELKRLRGCGIAHCPSSNMKLGSGICRTSELFKNGVNIGIAVDGSASNDGSNMLEEVRRAYLLNHLKYADKGLSAYDMVKIATKGGAKVLGRNDIGTLEEGKAADIVVYDLNDICYSGTHNPLTSLVCCGNTSIVDMTIINGEIVFKDGKLANIDETEVARNAVRHSKELIKMQRNLKSE
ncbi:MAG: 8-oxoguanine deaminase [Oscillospiraceae bacterium]|nr:8-oxoguanine deaminase [Oscillospiraceae bacterium]